jgi:hypothetical protein
MTIYHTMGVYNDGSRKHNGVSPAHLKEHIDYNLTARPGRAFFVDGVCLNNGYLSQERIDAITVELRETPFPQVRVTAPYQ